MDTLKTNLITDEQLVAELHRLGVDHLARFQLDVDQALISPAQLLTALAEHPEARLRGALILLFLRQPNFSENIAEAITMASNDAENNLRIYYQAAVYIQNEIKDDLNAYITNWHLLPDLFSEALKLPMPNTVTTSVGLTQLGKLHQQLTGWAYNWSGSYRQNVPLFLKHIKQASRERSYA
jgi:hypothetical protein